MHRQVPDAGDAAKAISRAGAKRVIVAAPVKDLGVLNIVVGVNDQLYDPARTASSPPPPAPPTASRRW
jgi:glyceraldehyde-3-phosphate dehydrogenase/erythrose-4-phosphate dehydrogenase